MPAWSLPQSCFLCGAESAGGLCAGCEADLPYQGNACPCCGSAMAVSLICGQCQKHPPAYSRSRALLRYAYPVDAMIIAGKFNQRLAQLDCLAGLVARKLPLQIKGALPQAIIPVPLHPRRLRERGYNQALILARPLARSLGIALSLDACERRIHTREQSALPAAERKTNVRGAFQAKRLPPEWRHVALFDDVVTTGSTVQELARVLRRAGVETVEVWSCART
jgi:ComF family protein